VNQGLTVFGNRGATDQHSYIQQLRDGVDNFFAVFVEVLKDRNGSSMQVEPGTTTGDFLHGFFLGTREALYESGRKSTTITVSTVSAFSVGALIALFERAVGIYALLINTNAYHQPGVQAGKVAADAVIKLQGKIFALLNENRGEALSAEAIALRIGQAEQTETVFKICEHLVANPDRNVAKTTGSTPFNGTYRKA
jgi:glucose-6-phosphate isomerase